MGPAVAEGWGRTGGERGNHERSGQTRVVGTILSRVHATVGNNLSLADGKTYGKPLSIFKKISLFFLHLHLNSGSIYANSSFWCQCWLY